MIDLPEVYTDAARLHNRTWGPRCLYERHPNGTITVAASDPDDRNGAQMINDYERLLVEVATEVIINQEEAP